MGIFKKTLSSNPPNTEKKYIYIFLEHNLEFYENSRKR